MIPTKSSGKDVPIAKIIAEIVKALADVSLLILLMAIITQSALLIRSRENKIITIIIGPVIDA